jgi:hypothetical protein
MNSIYIVQSFFENYESTTWKIIGTFTEKKLAEDVAKKWEDFYKEKKYSIFNEPKDWVPSESDLEYGDGWLESDEYSRRVAKYGDIMDFREILIDSYDMNKDRTLDEPKEGYPFISDDLRSIMTQWDRNYKLEKIIK